VPVETTIVSTDPTALVLLANNARYMTKDQFARLTDNVRRDGKLTSLPLVAPLADGRLEVLSGNHRTRAAVAAGLTQIDVVRIDSPLTADQRTAIQLSHNSIAGDDDPHKLKELFDSILDVDLREYSGLDDETLGTMLDHLDVPSIALTSLDYQALTLLLLPEQLADAAAVFDDAKALAVGDAVWVGRLAAFDALMDTLDVAQRITGSRNRGVELELVLETFRRHVTDWAGAALEDPPPGDLMATPAVLGWDMPTPAAATIAAAIARLTEAGEVDEPWQAVERWAAESLRTGP
jgi:hypothetical protein